MQSNNSISWRRFGFVVLAAMAVFISAHKASAREDVFLSATRVPMAMDRVGSSITTISSEEIEKLGAVEVTDILRTVPGLTVDRSGGFGTLSAVRIRGMESNHTLLLIDGVEVGDPSNDFGFDYGTLNANEIERIEVLRGPQSVLYGSDSIGGVIHIITKTGRGLDRGFTGQVRTRYGRHGTYETGGSARGAVGKWDWALGGNYFSTRGISAADEHDGNSESDANRNMWLGGKLGFQVTDNLRLDGVLRGTDTKTEFDNPFNLPPKPIDTHEESTQEDLVGKISATHTAFDGRMMNTVSAQRTEVKRETHDGSLKTDHAQGVRIKYDYQGTFRLTDPLTLVVGAETEEEEYRSVTDYSDWFVGLNYDNTTRNTAYFGQLLIAPADRLNVTLGLRDDRHSETGSEVTYRGTVSYVFPWLTSRIHASYGTGIQQPTPSELSGYGSFTLPNSDLKPETSQGWDLGFAQEFWDGRVQIDVTYFDNKIKDKITTEILPSWQYINENVDEASSRGVEAGLRFDPTDKLRISGAYSFICAKDEGTGDDLLRRPRHSGSVDLHYQVLDTTGVALLFTYTGNRYDFAYPENKKMKYYKLVDLRLTHDVNDSLQVFVEGKNLLREQYQELNGYGTFGRTFFGGVRYAF